MVTFKEAFDYAWGIFKRDWQFYVVSGLIVTIIHGIGQSLTPGNYASNHFSSEALLPWATFAHLVAFIIWIYGIVISINILNAALHTDKVKKIDDVKTIFNVESYTWRAVSTSIILGLIIGIGTFFLVIPGIVLALMYGFAVIIVVDKYVSISDAFKMSDKLTSGKKMDLFGLMLIILLVNVIPAIVTFGFSLIVTSPMTLIAYAYIYKKLRDGTSFVPETIAPVQNPTPTSSTSGSATANVTPAPPTPVPAPEPVQTPNMNPTPAPVEQPNEQQAQGNNPAI